MDVTKAAPPLDSPSRTSTGPPSSGNNPGASAPAAPGVDRVDIQPLDVGTALQILIAEVRAELTALLAPPAATMPVNPPPVGPAQASTVVIDAFLQSLADDSGTPADWSAAATRAELALQAALDRAVAAVAAWRNVPQFAVDAVKETRSVVAAQIGDEPPNALWLRPEWLGLAPRMQRYWRRRRLARRWLSDPDSPPPRARDLDGWDDI